MSVRILQNKCAGCGRCLAVCPGDLLTKGPDGKIQIRDVRDCWGCTACLKECRTGAIQYFLGADIGGMGSTLLVEQSDEMFRWKITSPEGVRKTIEIQRKDSNKY